MEIIYIIAGILIGGVIAWLILKVKAGADKGITQLEANALNDQINNLKIEKSAAQERLNIIQDNLKGITQDLIQERDKFLKLCCKLLLQLLYFLFLGR